MASVNPFKYGKAVRGEYFTDREDEIKTLLLDLKSCQNVILYSPRRLGKTSLILKVIDQLKKEKYICIYVDLYPISSKRDFAQRLASSILKDTSTRLEEKVQRLKEYLPNVEFSIKAGEFFEIRFTGRESDIERELTRLYELPQNIAQKRKKKVVVVFDEFQQIAQIDGEGIERSLRAKIQHHSDVAYVFMGSERHIMERIFNDKSRAFYKIGKTFTLRNIPKDRFATFIYKRFKETGVEIGQNLIEEVLEITDGHPYYTQMFMHELWNESYPTKMVTQDAISRAEEQIFLNEASYFTALWNSLSPKQKNLLVALISEEGILIHSQSAIITYELGSPATVSKSLKVLKEKEILEQRANRYIFSDVFFKEWIKRMR